MTHDQQNDQIDLGDAVAETKGASIVGTVDPLNGYKQTAGFSADD